MAARKYVFLFIRIFIGITYLWVVADRLGILGPIGNPGVVWGNFDIFLEYTATLNPWFPRGLSDFLGVVVTIAEVIMGILLISGFYLKEAALASLALLIVFTLSMLFSLGINAAYGFIIFTIILAVLCGLIFRETSMKA